MEIALSALPAADGAALVRNLVGSDALPARDVNALVARAGGNPFFLEELVRSLISSGALAEGAPGPNGSRPAASGWTTCRRPSRA